METRTENDATTTVAVPRPLAGQVAVVTGATSGIGKAIAHKLGLAGACVAVNGRSPDRTDASVDELRRAGVDAFSAVGNVSDDEAVRAMVAAVEQTAGRLDIVVNNAGVPLVHDSASLPPADWNSVLATNLSGPFFVAQAAFPLLARAGGVVINVSSIFGHVGMVRRAAYVTAKHGLEGLTKTLAVEWAPHGIRVLSVSPGYVVTPLVDQAMSAGSFDRSGPESRTPLGRMADADEVADVVAFLATPAASYVTGTSVAIDGGWLANGGWT